MFERNGDFFVCAFNMNNGWRADDERWLGRFKLAGLSAPILLEEKFDPLSSYDRQPPRSGDLPVLTI